MEEMHKRGLVKNIGVSNVGTLMIHQLMTYAKIKPAALQIELHPYLQQDKLIRLCREKGIAVTAFSSLASASYVEMDWATENEAPMKKPEVIAIAERH